MRLELIMLLSEMIDKMNIKDELINLEGKNNEEVAKKLFALIISKIYKVQDELYKFIIEYKEIKPENSENISKEEYKKRQIEMAKKINAIEIINEVLQINGVKDFLAYKQD